MYALMKKTIYCCLAVAVFSLYLGCGSVFAGSMVGLAPDSGDTVKLSELLDGTYSGVKVGDKEFKRFFYSRQNDMPIASNVDVYGFEDVNGNLGISFLGSFKDNPGDNDSSSALLRYTVTVDQNGQNAGWEISDAHLFMGAVNVGDDSIFSVDESFEEFNGITLKVLDSSFGQGSTILSDWTLLDPAATTLRVSKGIYAFAGENAIEPARAGAVDQSFSQTQIPEPTTLALLACSLIGVVATSRRR
jgi:hypothetical protein